MKFTPNLTIGPYTLIKLLGRGGFGEVWLGERRSKFVTTKVALKLPLDDQVDHDAIMKEATLWEQASGHPNVLPLLDADEYNGQVVIVSEYAPDGSLEEWLRKQPRPSWKTVAELMRDILSGLAFLHAQGIIHRDLKPANILMQGNTARLADFGISRAIRSTVSSQTANISGTFAYMSPEAFDGKRSEHGDIWSAGIVLYRLLTGSLPFPQKEPSELIAAIMLRDLPEMRLNIPEGLQTVCLKALRKNPSERYPTAITMLRDLEPIFSSGQLEQLQLTEDEQTVTRIHPFTPSVTFQSPLTEKNEPRTSGLRRYLIGAILAGFALILGTTLIWFKSTRTPPSNYAANDNAVSHPVEPLAQISTEKSNTEPPTPTPVPTPDKSQFRTILRDYITSHIASLPKSDQRECYSNKRHVRWGDIDDDGDIDAAFVFYYGYPEGASYVSCVPEALAVFKNEEGRMTFVAESPISYPDVQFTVKALKKGTVVVDRRSLTEEDPMCCPSIHATDIFMLSGNGLRRRAR